MMAAASSFAVSTLVCQAAHARELRAVDVRVLVAVQELLDYVEHRPLKVWPVARALGMAPATVRQALDRLAAAGFLDRRTPADPAQLVGYRLPASRAPIAQPLAKAPPRA